MIKYTISVFFLLLLKTSPPPPPPPLNPQQDKQTNKQQQHIYPFHISHLMLYFLLLLSLPVLSQGKEIDDTPDEVALLSCGVNFCPDTHAANNNTNLEKPPVAQIYTMASIYLACALLSSVIIAVFVDPLTK